MNKEIEFKFEVGREYKYMDVDRLRMTHIIKKVKCIWRTDKTVALKFGKNQQSIRVYSVRFLDQDGGIEHTKLVYAIHKVEDEN